MRAVISKQNLILTRISPEFGKMFEYSEELERILGKGFLVILSRVRYTRDVSDNIFFCFFLW